MSGSLGSKIALSEETIQEHCTQPSDSKHTADGLNKLIGSNAHVEQQLCTQHADSQHRVGSLLQLHHAHEQKDTCEALFSNSRIIDATVSFLQITNTVSEEVKANTPIMDWITNESRCCTLGQRFQALLLEFKSQCILTSEILGDNASNTEQQHGAASAYSTALSLGFSTPNTLLTKWARMALIRNSVNEALSATTKVCST